MEFQQLAIFICVSIAAIGGLIVVVLQKKGNVKPVVTTTDYGINVTSGGKITFGAVLVGVLVLSKYSIPMAIGYIVLFMGAYMVIHLIFKEKKELDREKNE